MQHPGKMFFLNGIKASAIKGCSKGISCKNHQNSMNESHSRFIKKQKCVSICCVNEQGKPYCFSSYYALNAEENLLYFKSAADTSHIKFMKRNPVIAGTILPDKLQVLVVQGIQFQGLFLCSHDNTAHDASKLYYRKFPFALVIPGEIWTIQLTQIKMTDSTKGFGNKSAWVRAEPAVLHAPFIT
jgi:uncharacterized protein YhbP (UPF0306 family)